MNVTELKMTDIIVNQNHNVRTVIAPETLEDLAQSIKKNGLQQPIVVRPSKKGFELVAGYRRIAAFELLKKSTIPAHITEVDDAQRQVINILENTERENLSTYDTAKGFVILKNDHGMSAEKIAARFKGQRGKSPPNVRNLIRSFENLEPQLLKQWAAGANWASWANVVALSSWQHFEQIAWVNAYPKFKAGTKVPVDSPLDAAGEGETVDPPAESAPRAKSRNLKEIDEMVSVMENIELANPLLRPAILATLAWCAGTGDIIEIS